MARINFNAVQFNAVRKIASSRGPMAWGKNNFEQNSALVFAGLLVVCSLAVGCSSEKPKTQGGASQPPMAQTSVPTPTSVASVPITPAPEPATPVHKKTVRKAPATVTYADKTSGVSFQYPRKYSLKTGESAGELVSEGAIPMGFVQPGGVAVAAVAVPEGAYPKSDLAAAFFDVSVNQSLTAEQCGSFPAAQATAAKAGDGTAPNVASAPKLMIGDMELQSSEIVAPVGTGKEASKFYHVFENGACYEFALKVATTGETDEGGKSVDRDEVFKRLGKILATVKIGLVKAPEVTAIMPAVASPATASVTPAQ